MLHIQLQTINAKNKKLKLTKVCCNRHISSLFPESEHIVCNDNSQFQQELLIKLNKFIWIRKVNYFLLVGLGKGFRAGSIHM